MKLDSIKIRNYQALTDVTLMPKAPVLLFAGANEAGKTSLLDALRHAFTGEFARVALKRDIGQLLRDGADAGSVEIAWRHGEDGRGNASVDLPGGARTFASVPIQPAGVSRALPYLLSPERIAALEVTELRALLFDLSGLSASPDAVCEKLIARGHDKVRVEDIKTILRGGFAPAAAECLSRAREARAAWKALTGETYGSVKAASWKKEAPDVDASRIAAADAAEAETTALLEHLSLDATAKNRAVSEHERISGELAAAKAAALLLFPRKQTLAKLTTDIAELRAEITRLGALATGESKPDSIPCPECGVMLMRDTEAGGSLRLTHYKAPSKLADPEAVAKLASLSPQLKRLESALAAAQAAVNESVTGETNQKRLEAELGRIVAPDAEAIAALAQRITETKDLQRSQRRDADALRQQLGVREGADQITAKALQAHTDVVAWDALAQALSPDGIPGEMLAQAVKGINAELRRQAELSGWAQVSITSDMAVRVEGRAYALCSESAQWRTDAQLAAALSTLSGARIFMLDRLDVLDLAEQRVRALVWLHKLAEAGEIDTVVVVGTLKALPKSAPSTFDCYWLTGGEVAPALAAAA